MFLPFRSYRPNKAAHLRGLARVAAFFSCTTLVCGLVSVRHAQAEIRDQTLVFGQQMFDLAQASNHEVTKIHFNGQPVHIGSSSTNDPPDQVLARYEEYCRANRGQTDFVEVGKDYEKLGQRTDGSDDPLTAMAKSAGKKGAEESAPEVVKSGFVRSTGANNSGAVVCFVKGAKSKATTSEAFESFMTTGELGAFGELRYAYASQDTKGKTLVLTAWTESTFNLRDMIPEDGQDAAGEDFAEIPRIPGSTRIMSARAADKPYGVNVYKTGDSPSRALAFYDREMQAAGWFTYDPEFTEAKHQGLGRAYMKNAVVVTLGTTSQAEGTFLAVGLSGVPADDAIGRR